MDTRREVIKKLFYASAKGAVIGFLGTELLMNGSKEACEASKVCPQKTSIQETQFQKKCCYRKCYNGYSSGSSSANSSYDGIEI